jgi:hypothetical protein
MGEMTAHIGIEPGTGLVARFGDTVVVVPREQPDGDGDGVRELLGLVASVAADEALSASMVAARLAAWVLGHMPGDAISFGMVAARGPDVVVFLRGPVSCTVTDDGMTRELSGERALTWVDEAMPATFDRLTISGGAGVPVTPDPLSDLREGVVPGRGFALTWLGAGAPAASGAATAAVMPPAEAAAPAAQAPAAPGAGRAAEAAAPDEMPAPEATPAGPGAMNGAAPAADFPGSAPGTPPGPGLGRPSLSDLAVPPLDFGAPATDTPDFGAPAGDAPDFGPPAGDPGVSAGQPVPFGHQETMRVESMPLPQQQRPGQPQPGGPGVPVGELRSEDGTVVSLDRAYVLGRGPHQDQQVMSGQAAPLPLRDPENLVSRIHAYVWVDQGMVFVRDPGSTHGTFISAPGAAEWTQIGADPAELLPGWSMRIGHQVFTYVLSGGYGG